MKTTLAKSLRRARHLHEAASAVCSGLAEARVPTKLSDSEERLRAILETAVEGIITIDERGLIESVNPSAEKIFGYNSRELIGQSINLLMPAALGEQHDGYIANYLRTGRAKIIGIGREVSGRRKNGAVFPMDLSVSEVKLANGRLFTGIIRDITERKQLEKQILEISEREQRRIGHDLHDGLCQHLAGIEFMSHVLVQKLSKRNKSAAAQATEIEKSVREAISQTRSLARGLSPVISEPNGLMCALNELAENTTRIFDVNCSFECHRSVLMRDHVVATNLFRIAQESVTNAVTHGKAKRISIRLNDVRGHVLLSVDDEGNGFVKKRSKFAGMGLRIMQSRAHLIGGTFAIEQKASRGVRVFCSVPKAVASGKVASVNGD